jgi:hypothetical protein
VKLVEGEYNGVLSGGGSFCGYIEVYALSAQLAMTTHTVWEMQTILWIAKVGQGTICNAYTHIFTSQDLKRISCPIPSCSDSKFEMEPN